MITRHKTIKDQRKMRVRRRLMRLSKLPRLSVFRSNKLVSAQVIDDRRGVTLAAANERELEGLEGAEGLEGGRQHPKIERATGVGIMIAKKAIKSKITKVVFDRGPYRFHGRVKALAEAARKGGLKF